MSFTYDYNDPPSVVGEYIFATGKTHAMMGWLGIGKLLSRFSNYGRDERGALGIRRFQLSDGTEAQVYPINHLMPDWSAIIYGVTDCTGSWWQSILKTKGPCWNHLELSNQMTAEEGDPALDRLARYRVSGAPLRIRGQYQPAKASIPFQANPEKWPEPYRSAWFAEPKDG
jgi:hypothetical protein